MTNRQHEDPRPEENITLFAERKCFRQHDSLVNGVKSTLEVNVLIVII